jgi:hypothetical protein
VPVEVFPLLLAVKPRFFDNSADALQPLGQVARRVIEWLRVQSEVQIKTLELPIEPFR